MAYDIDGKLNDWGLDLINNSWSANQTWLPNYGIWFVVEDNADPNYLGENGIDLSKTGVHIRGMGKWFEKYDEPKIWDGSKWIIEPSPIQYVSVSGGEKWDIEAMYVDEDADYIYVAIITSQNSSGWNWGSNHYYPSDLALNLDADESTGGYGYEYGIKLSTEGSNGGGGVQFGIYKTSTNSCWTVPSYLAENKPSRIVVNNAQPNGTAIGAYKSLGKTDNGVKNWVIELAIPKENVGMKGKWLIGNPVPKVLHVTETCGNDHIDVPISVPEFLNLLIPVGILLGSVLYFKRRAK
ncbi:MAG: hypothetical protein H0Z28_09545 [Archaeoglobus sp.]|nr:hypothetical protein [Archaeoglobus sp.]